MMGKGALQTPENLYAYVYFFALRQLENASTDLGDSKTFELLSGRTRSSFGQNWQTSDGGCDPLKFSILKTK